MSVRTSLLLQYYSIYTRRSSSFPPFWFEYDFQYALPLMMRIKCAFHFFEGKPNCGSPVTENKLHAIGHVAILTWKLPFVCVWVTMVFYLRTVMVRQLHNFYYFRFSRSRNAVNCCWYLYRKRWARKFTLQLHWHIIVCAYCTQKAKMSFLSIVLTRSVLSVLSMLEMICNNL